MTPMRRSCSFIKPSLLAMTALCVSALALPGWATVPSGESQKYEVEAAASLRKGDMAAAIIQLKNAVRADAGNLPARAELAQLYLATGDAPAAERELETARAKGYDEAKLTLPLAQAYIAQGKLDAVLKLDAAKAGDFRTALYALQARAQLAKHDKAAARALVDKALAEDAASPDALAADATLLRADGKIADAEARIDKALPKAPAGTIGAAELMIMKGELRSQQGDHAGAMKAFDAVVAKNPRYARAYVSRAMARLMADDLAGAGADVAALRTFDPNNLMGFYLEAFLRARENKPGEAAQILLAHQPLLDGYAPSEYLLAVASLADNKPEIARGYAEHYATRAPEDINGQRLVANVHLRLGNARKAIDILEPVNARAPTNAEVKLTLAQAYYSAGRAAEAVALFRQGLAADPGNAQVQYALAVSQLGAGAKSEAEAGLEKVIAANPGFLQANFVLVMSQLQNHETDKALKTAAAMIKASPNDPNGYNVQGTVQLAANDTAGAAASFKQALEKDPKFTAAALNLARLEEGRGNTLAAKTWYDKALAADRRNVTAYEGLAQLAFNGGDTPAGAKYLEQAIVAEPAAPGPRLKLISLYLSQKENQRALIAARDFVSAAPGRVEAYEALGRAQIAVGDYVNAIGTYRQIVTRLPDNGEAQRRLGRAYITAAKAGSGDTATYWREARIALDQAMRLAPESLPAVSDRVAVEQETKGPAEGLAFAQKLVAEKPDSAARLIALGDLQAAQKPADAVASYRKAAAIEPTGIGVQKLSAALAQSGQGAEAGNALRSWLAKHPEDHDTRLALVTHYIDTAKYDDAIRESEVLDRAAPNTPAVLNNLAWLYGQKKDPKAFAFAARAYELAPRSADVSDTYGWLQVTNGDAAKGVELLGKAHDLAPERGDIGYRYAVALEKKGDAVRAKSVLQKTLATPAAFTERPQAEKLLKQLGG